MSKKKPFYTPEIPRFSRQWWMGGLRNLTWVAVVTALIWIYADMEFSETQDVRATIRLTTGKDDRVTLLGPKDRTVDVFFKVQGSRSGLATFSKWLKDRGSALTFDVSSYDASEKDHQVPTTTVLDQVAGLTKRGITVLSADPGAVSFRLDKRIAIPNVPVDFQYKGAKLVGTPVITPAKVTLYAAESDWRKVEAALGEDKRKIKTKPVDLAGAPAGEPISAELIGSIVLPNGQTVTVDTDPASVKVEAQVDQQIAEKPFKIPVFVMAPLAWQEDNTWVDYKLVRKSGETPTKEVTIRGPKKELDTLNPDDVVGYVVLREDDKTPEATSPLAAFPSRNVSVRFPPNLHLELVGEPPKISFRLEKRAAAPPP